MQNPQYTDIILYFQPFSVSRSAISSFYHNNIMLVKDETGGDNIIDDGKEQWKDGSVFKFWAYNYNYPGTKEYHIYYTQNNYQGVMNETQRFTLSNFKSTEENENDAWHLKTSFWAFEDERVKTFIGKIITQE